MTLQKLNRHRSIMPHAQALMRFAVKLHSYMYEVKSEDFPVMRCAAGMQDATGLYLHDSSPCLGAFQPV